MTVELKPCVYCGEPTEEECPACKSPICPAHSFNTPLYAVCADSLACGLRWREAEGWTEIEGAE